VLAPRVAPLTATLGGLGGLLLLFVLVRGHDDLLGTAVLLVGAAYVLGLITGRHALDEAAPLVGAALLACTELATWSLEERLPVPADPRLAMRRAGAIGVLVLSGLAASGLVLAVAAGPAGSGLAWTFVGAAAAVVAVGVVARFASR
jgi:hypothetical protein